MMLADGPELVIIVNPHARRGGATRRLGRALRAFPILHARASLVEVASSAEVTAAVRSAPPDAVVVAAGGDGTANSVVAALQACGEMGRSVGIVPLGTGNALAHALGLGSIRRALTALARGRVRMIDLMTTTHPEAPVALVSISAGFESAVLQRQTLSRRAGPHLGVARGVLESVLRRWRGISLTLGGEALTFADSPIYNAGLYNHRVYAMGKVVVRDAREDDGRAEAVAALSGRAYWRAISSGIVVDAPETREDLRHRRWEVARFRSAWPLQVDGESVGPADFTVRVVRRGLRVIA
jgi:diacylglycerol kinase family enzyme